jgi:hypothetical protein
MLPRAVKRPIGPSIKPKLIRRNFVPAIRAPIQPRVFPQVVRTPPLSVVRAKRTCCGGSTAQVRAGTDSESTAKILAIQGASKGKVLIIVANGPSITEVPLEKLVNQPRIEILSINTPDPRLWPTTYWAFFDQSQLTRHDHLWHSYAGTVFLNASIKRRLPNTIHFRTIGGDGFSRSLDVGLHLGRSSVYAVMQIALWLDFDHIWLFGVDMNPDGLDGKLHFYGTNPSVRPEVRAERFAEEARHYLFAAKSLTAEERGRFTFCSAYNHHEFVKHFDNLDHRAAVEQILSQI